MTAVVFTPGSAGFIVEFRYTPSIVATIKETVPGYARSWDPQRKVWTVDPVWASVLADTLRCYGHTIVGLDDDPPRRHRDHSTGDADWARKLFNRVGSHRAGPVYRALSKCLHPDVGGDTTLQREMNDAYHELQRRESA